MKQSRANQERGIKHMNKTRQPRQPSKPLCDKGEDHSKPSDNSFMCSITRKWT